jgi:hypothetical protein
MKIRFHCPSCATEHALGAESEVFLTPMDTGLYLVRCSRGHATPTILQQMRFEILFEIGITAIADGYFREAISSFAASLERFLEFYILMVFKERGAQDSLHEKTWKKVSNQSERQLGAYFFLHALHDGAEPAYLHKSLVELRNQVIHKGRLPQREEAIRFGNAVLAVINPAVRRFKERSSNLLLQAIQQHQQTAAASSQDIISHVNCVNTTISLAYDLSVPDCEDIANLPQIRAYV